MHRSAIVSLLLAAACASSGTAAGSEQTQTLSVEGAGSLRVNSASSTVKADLPFPVTAVWRVLPAVYDSLAIPITRLDAPTRVIANEGTKIRQRLGKTALSQYFDCGATQIGQNADSYEIFLTVTTAVTAPAGSTTASSIATTVDASAKPVSFGGQSFSRCTSKGVLEARIAELVRAQLQR